MTSVLIVSHARIHRRGFCALLKNADGIKVVGECRGDEASSHARTKKPDIVLMDVAAHPDPMVIRSILEAWPRGRIVAVGAEDKDQDILFWMEHGASYFVTAEAEEPELFRAITEAASVETRLPARISRLLLKRVQELAKADATTTSAPRLTVRQREILRHLEEGCSIKEIAVKLSIEPSTVKNHVHRILQKAHVHSRFDAMARFNAEIKSRNSRNKT